MATTQRKTESPLQSSEQSAPLTSSSGHSRRKIPQPALKPHGNLVKLRTTAAGFAFVTVVASLFYSAAITKNVPSAMDWSHLEPTVRNLSNTPTTSTRSELRIYPKAYQNFQETISLDNGSIQKDPSKWTPKERSMMRERFQEHNRKSVYSLLLLPTNSTKRPPLDTNLQWGDDFEFLQEHFRKRHDQGHYEFHDVHGSFLENEDEAIRFRKDPDQLLAAWGNSPGKAQKPRLIHEHNICEAYRHAKEIANFQTPHVLVTHFNENWGTLSSEILDRTGDWGDIVRNMFIESEDGFKCDAFELLEYYLNSPNTLAVFTTQHQSIFDHPKVHSVPIGVANSVHGGRNLLIQVSKQKRGKYPGGKRPKLLMMNNSPSETRIPQIEAVIRNFGKKGVVVRNTYEKDDDGESWDTKIYKYRKEMSGSKFILCPSGIGWESYRIWEALAMGMVPVIERYKYRYEVIRYAPETGKLPQMVRTLERGEKASKPSAKKKRYLAKHNATLETIEYYDGWRKTLDDLPVVWIDGEFKDVPPRRRKTADEEDPPRTYLTPEFLESEYDRIASNLEGIRYEKLSSLYWLRMIESFLLLSDASEAEKRVGEDAPMVFANKNEQKAWENAMESLSSTFNDHNFFGDRKWRPATYKAPPTPAPTQAPKAKAKKEKKKKTKQKSPYLLGKNQPQWMAWVVLIQLKLAGLALLVTAIRRWDRGTTHNRHRDESEEPLLSP